MKKRSILQEMKDVYPMFRLCRLMYEDGHKWRQGDLWLKTVVANDFNISDEDTKSEVDARIRQGEGRGRDIENLVVDFIWRYYPEYRKQSDAFSGKVRIRQVPTELYAYVGEIIEHCLGSKYGYLRRDPQNEKVVILTDEGRDFASPPYLYLWWKKCLPINLGLVNGYLKSLGESRLLVANLLVTLFTLWFSWVVWGASLLQYLYEK